VLRRLVEFVLLKAGLSPILTESPTGVRSLRGARLMIRLRPDDQILLRERAAARGMPPATYVSVLTRAHLRSLAPLPAEELLALKRTIGELGSIGRNLNQIARAANQGQLVTSPGRDDLTAMLRVCGTLRDSLKRVLLANLKSWEQGSPSPSPERFNSAIFRHSSRSAELHKAVPSGRHFASWLGLTARERSSAETRRLGGISKRGDVYLRTLLVHGARSALLAARRSQQGYRCSRQSTGSHRLGDLEIRTTLRRQFCQSRCLT
jgi:Transposase IS116/IS110/IS902 family/Bacterial mobilisation protein (MobC)